jgi:ArsR family transcriptional regulator, arsenate/arsenite/antimonite-responsive transcriptional repressor
MTVEFDDFEFASRFDICQIRPMPKQLPVLAQELACCAPLVRQPLDAVEAAELAAVLKALGEPVRLRLLSLIGAHDGGEACVCELLDAFELTPPTISHHLKVLREAGLIDSERRGTWVYYWVRPEAIARLGALFTPTETAALVAVR